MTETPAGPAGAPSTRTVAARIALIGDRSPTVRSHSRIPAIIEALRDREGLLLDAYWIPTDEVAGYLGGFDAIWLTPGSPYLSQDGAIAAVRIAREQGIPFLGTCAGFQHALVEVARHVCGLDGVGDAQYPAGRPGREPREYLIVPLACSLVGHEDAVRVAPGTLAERILGSERTIERYHCAFGLNPGYVATLAMHGVRFSGHDDQGQVRIAELPGHPFFVCTLFQPELSDGTRPHPVVRALAAAAVAHAGPRPGAERDVSSARRRSGRAGR
jgi:CTP synthase (UTP-ammonia lyase)